MRSGRPVNINDWEKQSQVLTNWNDGTWYCFSTVPFIFPLMVSECCKSVFLSCSLTVFVENMDLYNNLRQLQRVRRMLVTVGNFEKLL